MRSFAIALCVFFVIGCGSDPNEAPNETSHHVSAESSMSFRERQEFLFHGIDAELVCQGCQELSRLHREGGLSARTYYCDDSAAKLSELPESVRALQPTSVEINELMVNMTFLSDDGVQHLQCVSNEFGDPETTAESPKGLGFRKNPYTMHHLSGAESLDYLNANYKHFQMTLAPGLTYQVYDDEPPSTLEEIKRRTEGMAEMFTFVDKSVAELVVKKQRLLYKTDHNALLAACQEVTKHFNEGAFSRAKINVVSAEILKDMKQVDREKYAKDLKQIPAIILGLEPVYLWFDKDRVTVALIGGFDHAGVLAYISDGSTRTEDDELKLIDGLQYYDDGLREVGEEYRDYLKSLQEEALSFLDWRRRQEDLPQRK